MKFVKISDANSFYALTYIWYEFDMMAILDFDENEIIGTFMILLKY